MTNLSVTRMSSKGQIVIPNEMRKEFKEGEEFVIIKNGKQLILKSIKDFDENLKQDLIFAKRTEEAWKRYEKGEFKSMDADDFIKMLNRIKDGKN
ncbi:MAG: AbrB/MazE/SpoVT family DNA-binding domain-containing protein [Nanoarchaeota archaeon]